MVLTVEVRPNLLSGEPERFLLEDVRQVKFSSIFVCALGDSKLLH